MSRAGDMDIWNELFRYIREHDLIREGDTVVVGVSGGADSVCLLLGLYDLRRQLGCSLVVCHVNHQLRGAAAVADEQFVRKLSARLELPSYICRRDVQSRARACSMSIEEAGRYVRRECFMRVADARRKKGAKNVLIATAHHMNDHAETILMNLARGSGLRGLCGLRPSRDIYIKPLLCMERDQIEAILDRLGEPYRTDESNRDEQYTRNRIRHGILPVLTENVNSRCIRHFFQTSEQLQQIREFMDRYVTDVHKRCAIYGGSVCFLKNSLQDEMPVIVGMVCQRAIETCAGEMKNIGSVHIDRLAALFQKQAGRTIQLPYHMEAIRRRDGIVLRARDGREPDEEIELVLSGETYIDENCCFLCDRLFVKSSAHIPQKDYTKWIDYDTIEHRLVVRHRRPGDRIVISSDGKSKTLKKFFVDEKIAADVSRRLWLVADGNRIVWIPGVRLSSHYYVSEGTSRLVRMECVCTKEESDGGKNRNFDPGRGD